MTLSQNTIDQLKLVMANKQSRLPEDIEDNEVFEYVNEVYLDEQDDSVKIKYTKNGDECYSYTEPRTKKQIVADMIQSLDTTAYLAYI